MLYIYDTVKKERTHDSELECEMTAIGVHPINGKIFSVGG